MCLQRGRTGPVVWCDHTGDQFPRVIHSAVREKNVRVLKIVQGLWLDVTEAYTQVASNGIIMFSQHVLSLSLSFSLSLSLNYSMCIFTDESWIYKDISSANPSPGIVS